MRRRPRQQGGASDTDTRDRGAEHGALRPDTQPSPENIARILLEESARPPKDVACLFSRHTGALKVVNKPIDSFVAQMPWEGTA